MILLLAMAAWLGGACVVCSAQSDAIEPEVEQAQLDRGASDSEEAGETDSLFTRGLDLSERKDYEVGGKDFFIRMMLAVVFVVVLGVAAVYVSRKLLPKITRLPGKEIRVVETAYLGPRKAVHLIEVGKRRFLVGSTNENIRKLAEITTGFGNLSDQDIDFG